MSSPQVLEAIEHICQRLSERRVALFLGAGINYGLKNDAGIACPLGQSLSDMIACDVLGMASGGQPLDTIAEMAIYRVGESGLNGYLRKLFKSFRPTTQHLTLSQLPWNVIYTTNYDTLVEDAFTTAGAEAAGKLRVVFWSRQLTDDIGEEEIVYFKLHGCIDHANSEAGRLIITKEDYEHYQKHRKPLFQRLREDVIHQTLLFVGYANEDSNFRTILQDCRMELDIQELPQSYAVRVGVTPEAQAFWKEKYNIIVLNIDGQEFLRLLREAWDAQNCQVVPFDVRQTRAYTKFDANTSFQKVGQSFYLVRATDCTSPPRAKEFFRGASPTWGDIRERVAPHRDVYFGLLDALLDELIDPTLPGGVYLLTGAAGTGKTTLVRSLAYELSAGAEVPVVIHIPMTPLDERVLVPLVEESNPKRVVIIVENAAERMAELERFVADIKRSKKVPYTIILSERKNLWEYATSRGRGVTYAAEFQLERLSRNEIERILDSLEQHGALGKLSGASREYQITHFEDLAGKQLLVALRELTDATSFDDIIKHEYQQIPSEKAKEAYRYVAALGQIDEPIRLEVLARSLKLDADAIYSEVMAATEGILLSGEDFGVSRHNSGFRVRARHPVIASVIFAAAAYSDEEKYEIIQKLIKNLSSTFPEDRRVLSSLVRRKALVGTIASDHLKRAIYDLLETKLPDDAFVLQHRSLLERDLDAPDEAIKYARKAIDKQPNNPAFKNTLGFAYEAKARRAEPLERDGLLRQAEKIFEDGIRASRSDAYGYLGLHNVMRTRERNEHNPEKREKLLLEMLSLLEDGYEATGQSHLLSSQLALTRQTLGERESARDFLAAEVKRHPLDGRLRDLLVRMLRSAGKDAEALKVAEEGVKYSPTDWRLQRHIARLLKLSGGTVDAISGHYEAAFRHNKGDASLMAEYGAYLFTNGRYPESEVLFSQGRNLPGGEKREVKEYWHDDHGRDRVFEGYVRSIASAVGFVMAVPLNFTAIFWRTVEPLTSLRQGDKISFLVGFTASGAVAKSIRRQHS